MTKFMVRMVEQYFGPFNTAIEAIEWADSLKRPQEHWEVLPIFDTETLEDHFYWTDRS